jgi:hypothetical protein
VTVSTVDPAPVVDLLVVGVDILEDVPQDASSIAAIIIKPSINLITFFLIFPSIIFMIY